MAWQNQQLQLKSLFIIRSGGRTPAHLFERVTSHDTLNSADCSRLRLAGLFIAYRIGGRLREKQIDWDHAMVLVSGQSGRPTAGVTWLTNNICNLIWKSSDKQIAPERIFVAPHAPGFSVDNLPNAEALRDLEKTYRQIWCHTRASVDVARKMFQAYEAFTFKPLEAEMLPAIKSLGDHEACVARFRRIMEDPQQLLSNCVADYIIDELIAATTIRRTFRFRALRMSIIETDQRVCESSVSWRVRQSGSSHGLQRAYAGP